MLVATSPRPRTPAQIEAARRNGARSHGPVTAEGKARSSMNALKHGLATPDHILIPGEDAGEFEALHANLVEEFEPKTPAATELVHQLAVTFWKQHRAQRLEQQLFVHAERPTFIVPGQGIQSAPPEAFFDLKRFNAIRSYQAQLSREAARLLKLLREMREAAVENEPEARPSSRLLRRPTAGQPLQQRLPHPGEPRWLLGDEGEGAALADRLQTQPRGEERVAGPLARTG